MLNDNRLHPRVKADFGAEILDADSSVLKAQVVNLSVAGLMIRTSQKDFNRILSSRKHLQDNEPTQLYISFQLPTSDSTSQTTHQKITLYCRAIYVRRKAQDHYLMGFRFLEPSNTEQALLQSYVNRQLGR